MRIQPSGANLLDTVRTLLRDEVLPHVPKDKTYALLMSLNALGIAMRQLENGDDAENTEYEALRVLLDKEGSADELNRMFATLVRSGAADHDETLQGLLWQQTLQRVIESAPRYLRQEGLAEL